MRVKVRLVRDPEQRMEQTAVGEIDFRSFDLTFFEVFVPGLKLSNDKSGRQNVEIVADCCVVNTEVPGKLRRIPDLSVEMGDHGPKSPECRGADANAKLWQVSFKERANEVLSPIFAF